MLAALMSAALMLVVPTVAVQTLAALLVLHLLDLTDQVDLVNLATLNDLAQNLIVLAIQNLPTLTLALHHVRVVASLMPRRRLRVTRAIKAAKVRNHRANLVI